MTSKTKGEFLVKYFHYHKDYPKWDNAIKAVVNEARQSFFVEKSILTMTNENFEKIIKMWESGHDDVKSDAKSEKPDDTKLVFGWDGYLNRDDTRRVTTTINLKKFYSDVENVKCLVCDNLFDNEEEVLAHLSHHRDEQFFKQLK